MKIYTKTGDKGETGLFGGERVAKNALRVETYGTVDELNSFLGFTLEQVKEPAIKEVLQKIQNDFFTVGCDLATPMTEANARLSSPRVQAAMYQALEQEIDRFTAQLPPLNGFILPGGSPGAAALHVARTVCRRAERRVVTLSHSEEIGPHVLIYLNRLSDLLFVLARYENTRQGIGDVLWQKPGLGSV
jgi:cob(I)alamin adenosyltransferase